MRGHYQWVRAVQVTCLGVRLLLVLGYEYDTGVRSTVFFCDLHLSDIRVRYWSRRRMSRRMLAPTSDYDIRLRHPTTTSDYEMSWHTTANNLRTILQRAESTQYPEAQSTLLLPL